MDQILEKLKNKQDLTFEESKTAFEILMSGNASDDEIFSFLTMLSEKGEVSDEIAGGVFILREKSKISSSLAFPVINISKAVLLSSKVKFCLFLSFSKI